MNTIQLLIFKVRKGIYLFLERIQSVLLPIEMRTGKFFDLSSGDKVLWRRDLSDNPEKIDSLLKTIDQKGLFIVGAGRSGTTILRRVLNSSSEICLWHEANLYFNFFKSNFRQQFNKQHELKAQEKKATFISEPVDVERNAFQTLERVGRSFTYCGEKLVFLANNKPQDFFDFHTRFFLHSTYFFTLRNPAEVVWSMTKMFPEESIQKFILIWLKSAEITLRSLGTFEKSYLLFQEQITGEMVDVLEKILSVELPFPKAKLAPRQQSSSLAVKGLPEKLSAYSSTLDTCTRIYIDILANFSPSTFKYSGEKDEWVYLLSKRIQLKDCISALEFFPANSLDGKAALMGAMNNNFAIYFSGLSDDEINQIDLYKSFNRAKVEANIIGALQEEFEEFLSGNRQKLMVWSLDLLTQRLQRISREEACKTIYKRILDVDPGNQFKTNANRLARKQGKGN